MCAAVFQAEHGNVVKLRGAVGKAVHRLPHLPDQGLRLAVRVLIQGFDHPLFAEQFLFPVGSLCHAVSIHKDAVAATKLKFPVLKLRFFVEADDDSVFVFQRLKISASASQAGVFMPRVAGKALSGGDLQYGQPYCDKHHRGVLLAQLDVHVAQCRCRVAAAHQLVLDQGF